jgi:hypothetical protein
LIEIVFTSAKVSPVTPRSRRFAAAEKRGACGAHEGKLAAMSSRQPSARKLVLLIGTVKGVFL